MSRDRRRKVSLLKDYDSGKEVYLDRETIDVDSMQDNVDLNLYSEKLIISMEREMDSGWSYDY